MQREIAERQGTRAEFRVSEPARHENRGLAEEQCRTQLGIVFQQHRRLNLLHYGILRIMRKTAETGYNENQRAEQSFARRLQDKPP